MESGRHELFGDKPRFFVCHNELDARQLCPAPDLANRFSHCGAKFRLGGIYCCSPVFASFSRVCHFLFLNEDFNCSTPVRNKYGCFQLCIVVHKPFINNFAVANHQIVPRAIKTPINVTIWNGLAALFDSPCKLTLGKLRGWQCDVQKRNKKARFLRGFHQSCKGLARQVCLKSEPAVVFQKCIYALQYDATRFKPHRFWCECGKSSGAGVCIHQFINQIFLGGQLFCGDGFSGSVWRCKDNNTRF